MCRSKACGGRRCDTGPGKAERRRAYQREWLRNKRKYSAGSPLASPGGDAASLTQERFVQDFAEATKGVSAARDLLTEPESPLSMSERRRDYARAVEKAGAVLAPEWERRVAERMGASGIDAAKSRVSELDDDFREVSRRMQDLIDRNNHKSAEFPVIRDRFTDAERDEFDSLSEKRDAIGNALTEARDVHWKAVTLLKDARRDTTLEMLREIRPMGAEVGQFADGTSKAARSAANDATALLPAAWVENTNQNAPALFIGSGHRRRAHYRHNGRGSKRVKRRMAVVHGDYLLDQVAAANGAEIVPGGYDEDGNELPGRISADSAGGVKEWLDARNSTSRDYNRRLSGRERRNYGRDALEYDENPDGTLSLYRVRTSTSKGDTRSEIVSSVNDPSTMLHEMSHRMEATNIDISMAALAWRDDRAGDEELSLIYEKKSGKPAEKGYKDGFADHYIGKVYPGSDHSEVISMGMEMLMFGRHGAFDGDQHHKADTSHRDFMLGLLATAGATTPAEFYQERNRKSVEMSERNRRGREE